MSVACNFSSVPTDVIITIFSFLDVKNLAKCQAVCRLWREYISKNLILSGKIEIEKEVLWNVKNFRILSVASCKKNQAFIPHILALLPEAQIFYGKEYGKSIMSQQAKLHAFSLDKKFSEEKVFETPLGNLRVESILCVKVYTKIEIAFSTRFFIYSHSLKENKNRQLLDFLGKSEVNLSHFEVLDEKILYFQNHQIWICDPKVENSHRSILSLDTSMEYMKLLPKTGDANSTLMFFLSEKNSLNLIGIEEEMSVFSKPFPTWNGCIGVERIGQYVFFAFSQMTTVRFLTEKENNRFELSDKGLLHHSSVTCLTKHDNVLISFGAEEIRFWRVDNGDIFGMCCLKGGPLIPSDIENAIAVKREKEYFSLFCLARKNFYLLSSSDSLLAPFKVQANPLNKIVAFVKKSIKK